MTVISVTTDDDSFALTLVAEFDAPPEHVWRLWEDPRLLEQWWGPPGWPATFDEHRFVEGGRSVYYMTGPSGEKPRGWWQFLSIDEPSRIEFYDGFADERGEPTSTVEPMRMVATLSPVDGRTRMTLAANFSSAEQMQALLDMGMAEGIRQAAGQIDELLTR